MRRAALTPEPDLRGGTFAGRDPRLIDRMISKHISALPHQALKQILARTFWEIIRNRLVGNIVRRLSFRFPRKWRRSLARPKHQNISIADARMKLQAGGVNHGPGSSITRATHF